VRISKNSVVGLLLETGEEDLAVLLARSDLPEQLDSDADADRLARIGLGPDEVSSLLPAVTSSGHQRPGLTAREVSALEQAISERWADLVTAWVAAPVIRSKESE